MDRTKLKNYAPKARREFIEGMTERAEFYGLTSDKTVPIVEKGDVAVIGGRSFAIAVARKRKSLEDRIKRHGFQQTMEAMAYTWFNRLVSIRYMELHGYLDHGYRVLSHPDGKPTPEILEHAEHVDFPGLKKDRVIDLKLAGNKESELYRLLLTAQCNALHSAMPFLFERIDDETELLLPDNLLNSDSLIRKLVNEIDEADWQEVEIIGWLYQFYISEKKDEVIGKVVASEDIPAATQLFTPNWIVKYLVQNTLGRQWLATYPDSPLRQQMEYYIEPASQTPEVQEQLKTITPTSLNPEELTLLDPACGSGHILVEAYDLFKAIYLERGYRAKDIPALILQKNLFGMEIDDRAAQLAAFALMMKARADDRRIFESEAKPNILAFEDSQGMKANEIAYALNAPINKDDVPNEYLLEEIQEEKDELFSKKALAEKGHVSQGDIAALLELFENAKTFGSLIQVPPKMAAKLPEIERRLENALKLGDLTHASAHILKPLLQQARLLARQYDAVVANPPYMGSGGMNDSLKTFAKEHFPNAKSDVFACFIERAIKGTMERGRVGVVAPYVWMFLSSYQQLRAHILDETSLLSLIQLEYNAFEPACIPVATFTLMRRNVPKIIGSFIKLSEFKGHLNQSPKTLEAIKNPECGWFFEATPDEFKRIPSSPVAYWVSENVRRCYRLPILGSIADVQEGLKTGDNARFIRKWFEVDYSETNLIQGVIAKWFQHTKGGGFRRWYGNCEDLLLYANDGDELRAFQKASLTGQGNYLKENISWGRLTSARASFRFTPSGSIPNMAGLALYPRTDNTLSLCGYLNSKCCELFLALTNPTLNFPPGTINVLPVAPDIDNFELSTVAAAVSFAQTDWDAYERSWDFRSLHVLTASTDPTPTLESSYTTWITKNRDTIAKMKRLEEENNRLFIAAYGLADELTPDVPIEQITLTVNPAYRYGGKLSEEEQWTRFRQDTMEELVSYAVGCMMGRYSLDAPGLIYAHSRNKGFDTGKYKKFRADDDGIIPLLETDWGVQDDAANRVVEFVSVAWPKEHLEENLKFIAESLGQTSNEQPRDTIRHYLAVGFYKNHLQTYKKRPIYWLFSSGKQRAFQCLVYLHRYHEGTLARMRTEYVIPLQGQIAARIDQLEGDKAKATSTSHRTKIQKEQEKIKKQQVELATFEEKLKHYADMRISLDLDDGVKVNYAKFGDLLAESKAITGGKDED
jgi:type II restriction/modification system DNA methylase subunit YeeA